MSWFHHQSESYANFRPRYPQSLFHAIYPHCRRFHNAVDLACGNGQASIELAKRYKNVHASDLAAEQIARAPKRHNISWHCGSWEKSLSAMKNADLITVAQAFHWFDHESFFRKLETHMKKSAILAVWGYGIHELFGDAPSNDLVRSFYEGSLGEWWPPERTIVEGHYIDIEFPGYLKHINVHLPLFMEKIWTFEQHVGYLQSWSATTRKWKATGIKPVETELLPQLIATWPGNERRLVRWPLFLKLFRR